jgi:hypothetical protein
MVVAAFLLLQGFHIYIGNLAEKSVTIAWGRADSSGNTIGRDSRPYGKAQVHVGDKVKDSEKNWAEIDGLAPDTVYPYRIDLKGKTIGEGSIRTWPEKSARLAFFVIGDYGNGSEDQRRVADAMAKEYEKRAATGNPVRFVITTGDNIYADVRFGGYMRNSGSEDEHWESKFFVPYRTVLEHIPFYPSLGNHDGNSTERREDLGVYMDNFFFPDGKPHRWYSFKYADLAEFFALDTSNSSDDGRRAPVYLPDGEQFQWLSKEIANAKAPWKIPYFHHPLFNAGPRHRGDLAALRHFHELFQRAGVRSVFSGHEHNFQFSQVSPATGGIRYVISGAGGELRPGNVRSRMSANHIAGWAMQRHFLVVEILGTEMKITPVSDEPMRVIDADGAEVKLPVMVDLHAIERELLTPSGAASPGR